MEFYGKGGSRMLKKNQRKWCYFIVCILFMAGIYTTYIKADSFAERVASVEIVNSYTLDEEKSMIAVMNEIDRDVQLSVCVVERMNPTVRTVMGRITNRIGSIRKDLRFASIFLWVLCVALFLLQCCLIEEILCLLEKKYRAALIKYIHDIDGKKRVPCLKK